MKKANVLLIVAVIFQIMFLLVFTSIIDLYAILASSLAKSIIDFLCSGAIVSGFIASYIYYEENKKISVGLWIISTLFLVIYIFSALIGTM
ncbi:hypothetical protein [Romboutsia hominis]|uniref:hypothetical protein n=1 Tax=Romboutsia hominis TaxID=1507512 RepID=UPI001F05678B|nr:hypothetical protein [Romboutsia hominis]MCH1959004.1 hypothetical protein [Romboutsia hominis]MCH1968128.1 hypothetical protein [Romboutsia hominis]